MLKFVIFGVASLAFVGTAVAADLPRPQPQPVAAPVGKISHGQISRRQEPNWQIPGRGTGSDQRLIRISIRSSAAFVGVPTQSAGRLSQSGFISDAFPRKPC